MVHARISTLNECCDWSHWSLLEILLSRMILPFGVIHTPSGRRALTRKRATKAQATKIPIHMTRTVQVMTGIKITSRGPHRRQCPRRAYGVAKLRKDVKTWRIFCLKMHRSSCQNRPALPDGSPEFTKMPEVLRSAHTILPCSRPS